MGNHAVVDSTAIPQHSSTSCNVFGVEQVIWPNCVATITDVLLYVLLFDRYFK